MKMLSPSSSFELIGTTNYYPLSLKNLLFNVCLELELTLANKASKCIFFQRQLYQNWSLMVLKGRCKGILEGLTEYGLISSDVLLYTSKPFPHLEASYLASNISSLVPLSSDSNTQQSTIPTGSLYSNSCQNMISSKVLIIFYRIFRSH